MFLVPLFGLYIGGFNLLTFVGFALLILFVLACLNVVNWMELTPDFW